MKNILLSLTIFSSLFISSCKNNTEVEIIADFEISLAGQSPEAIITITNLTAGATSYKWEFSEGADTTGSNIQVPPKITIDKTGTFTITLTATNETETKTVSKTIDITGFNGINKYQNIPFGATSESAGRSFSIEMGQIYSDDEISETNSYLIDLVFVNWTPMYFFESPDSSNHNVDIPNPNTTIIENATDKLSEYDFNNIISDEFFQTTTVIQTNNSFNLTSLPTLILFKTTDNKTGVILAKEFNDGNIITDIKVQKY